MSNIDEYNIKIRERIRTFREIIRRKKTTGSANGGKKSRNFRRFRKNKKSRKKKKSRKSRK
jgi:hypothetical protein